MTKLRAYFLLLFAVLGALLGGLVYKMLIDLDRDAFLSHRRMGEEQVARVHARMVEVLGREQARPFLEYRYVHVSAHQIPGQETVTLSPLASFPPDSPVPGILGYFQVDPDRTFHTPMLPYDDEKALKEMGPERFKVRDQLLEIVRSGFRASDNKEHSIKEWVNSDIEEKTLGNRLDAAIARAPGLPPTREEIQYLSPRQFSIFATQLKTLNWREGRTARFLADPDLPETIERKRKTKPTLDSDTRVTTEVDPFQLRVADGKWLVFYRSVWWQDRRFVQGFVADLPTFFRKMTSHDVEQAGKSLVFLKGRPIVDSQPKGTKPILLYRALSPSPFSEFQTAYVTAQVPKSPASGAMRVFFILTVFLVAGGLYSVYRVASVEIELSQKKSDFVASVSHELKTPVTTIRMYGEMLLEHWGEDPDKRATYLRFIRDEGERLSRLIENVLQLARLDRAGPVRLVSIDAASLLKEMQDVLEGPVSRAGMTLETAHEGAPRKLLVNEDALKQVLINLVDNAIKFSRDAPERKIVLRFSQTKDHAFIHIRDFGCGIPEDQRERIFEKFYRIEDPAAKPSRGTGLGLALAKMLMEKMNGTIEVVRRDPGTEFVLRLDAVD